jgi:beta-galactosidase GanA
MQGTSPKPHTEHVMHFDLYPPPLEEEEELEMHPSPLKDSTMGIEREEYEPDQWASPMAISKMDKSRGSTNDLLFYFTAASELSGSTQESHWGLESTDGGSTDEFNYICDLKTGDVAVVSKKDPQDVVIWQQPGENLDTLEAEPTCTDELSPTNLFLIRSRHNPADQMHLGSRRGSIPH